MLIAFISKAEMPISFKWLAITTIVEMYVLSHIRLAKNLYIRPLSFCISIYVNRDVNTVSKIGIVDEQQPYESNRFLSNDLSIQCGEFGMMSMTIHIIFYHILNAINAPLFIA